MEAPKLRWVILGALIAFITAVLVTSFFREIKKIDELSAMLDQKMDEFVKTEQESQRLKHDIKYYSTPEGIARMATEQFDMVKSGDRLYKIEIVSGDN